MLGEHARRGHYIAVSCLRAGQVVMELIIILAELEHASLFAEASQLY